MAILTTNRKYELDKAFKSIPIPVHPNLLSQRAPLTESFPAGRIHFTVHYPDLDQPSRQEVWKNFMNTVARASELSEFTEDFVALSQHKLNGRQARCNTLCLLYGWVNV